MPVLRLAGLRAEGASRTAPLPAPPGNASLGLAVSAIGLQVGIGFRVQLQLPGMHAPVASSAAGCLEVSLSWCCLAALCDDPV